MRNVLFACSCHEILKYRPLLQSFQVLVIAMFVHTQLVNWDELNCLIFTWPHTNKAILQKKLFQDHTGKLLTWGLQSLFSLVQYTTDLVILMYKYNVALFYLNDNWNTQFGFLDLRSILPFGLAINAFQHQSWMQDTRSKIVR